uniref:Uncharacterized protein n=1 Tax=Octopus bimaculoides TaxID=37653 RepID=A0A0L8FQU7_OCTBM
MTYHFYSNVLERRPFSVLFFFLSNFKYGILSLLHITYGCTTAIEPCVQATNIKLPISFEI